MSARYEQCSSRWQMQRRGLTVDPAPAKSERWRLEAQIRAVVPAAIEAFLKDNAALIEPTIRETDELCGLSVRVPFALNAAQRLRSELRSIQGENHALGPISTANLDKIQAAMATVNSIVSLIESMRDAMEAKVIKQSDAWLEEKATEYDRLMARTHNAQAVEEVAA